MTYVYKVTFYMYSFNNIPGSDNFNIISSTENYIAKNAVLDILKKVLDKGKPLNYFAETYDRSLYGGRFNFFSQACSYYSHGDILLLNDFMHNHTKNVNLPFDYSFKLEFYKKEKKCIAMFIGNGGYTKENGSLGCNMSAISNSESEALSSLLDVMLIENSLFQRCYDEYHFEKSNSSLEYYSNKYKNYKEYLLIMSNFSIDNLNKSKLFSPECYDGPGNSCLFVLKNID